MKKLLLLIMFPIVSIASSKIEISPVASRNYPPEMVKEIQDYNNQLKSHGYVKQDLMVSVKQRLEIFDHKDDEEYLNKIDFFKDQKNVKTMFPFTPINKGAIAFGGALTKTDTGWAGIAEIFYPSKDIGICWYNVYYFGASFGEGPSAHLNPENMTNKVSGKPTKIEIVGSNKNGYMYLVRWYDNRYVREIECYNNEFDFSIREKVVELAKETDSKL